MAVTGEISELPLPELLNMMRHRAGKLYLQGTAQVSEMVLHFTPGYLCGFQSENRILKSEVQVVDKLVAVTASPVGRFVFEPRHASSLMGSVRISIDRLALIIVSKVDELSVHRAQLPPAHRVFRLTPAPEDGSPRVLPAWEDYDLGEFYHASETLLRCGISAEKLATIEQISVEQTQLYLYKLALLDLATTARRDDQWAQLDRVLEAKSTPLRLTVVEDGEGSPGRPPARPPRMSLPRPPLTTPKIGLGSSEQRKIPRLTGPSDDGEDPGDGELPPAA